MVYTLVFPPIVGAADDRNSKSRKLTSGPNQINPATARLGIRLPSFSLA